MIASNFVKISASILSADFAYLSRELDELKHANVDMVHIDVMDGHFVPNLTFGPSVIKSMRSCSDLIFDTHLMIDRPELFINDYIKAGSDMITIHPESTCDIYGALDQIKNAGLKSGIALTQSTDLTVIDNVIDKIDLILIMTVDPGFGGQKFIHHQLKMIQYVSQKIQNSNLDILISVDGGISDITATLCKNIGVDILVSGNFIFSNGNNYKSQVSLLKE
ncbi:MAG: ribulose-phosphate 3-epimerase [Rickettsiaceae bacterium]